MQGFGSQCDYWDAKNHFLWASHVNNPKPDVKASGNNWVAEGGMFNSYKCDPSGGKNPAQCPFQ